MTNENWKVYKHTTPSKKVYIGITSQSLNERWRNGKGYKENKYFMAAINKYGWKNINHEILFDGLTKEEAEQKEIELIRYYRSSDKNYGYNIDFGGSCGSKMSQETKLKLRLIHIGKKMSIEAREKMSKARKGRVISEETKKKMSISQKGRKHTLETRNKMSQKQKGKNNGFYGKHHTEETRMKMSESRKGENNGFYGKTFTKEQIEKLSLNHSKKIICVESGIVYKNAKVAAVSLGHENKGTNIQNAVNNANKTAYGYHWRYLC